MADCPRVPVIALERWEVLERVVGALAEVIDDARIELGRNRLQDARVEPVVLRRDARLQVVSCPPDRRRARSARGRTQQELLARWDSSSPDGIWQPTVLRERARSEGRRRIGGDVERWRRRQVAEIAEILALKLSGHGRELSPRRCASRRSRNSRRKMSGRCRRRCAECAAARPRFRRSARPTWEFSAD